MQKCAQSGPKHKQVVRVRRWLRTSSARMSSPVMGDSTMRPASAARAAARGSCRWYPRTMRTCSGSSASRMAPPPGAGGGGIGGGSAGSGGAPLAAAAASLMSSLSVASISTCTDAGHGSDPSAHLPGVMPIKETTQVRALQHSTTAGASS